MAISGWLIETQFEDEKSLVALDEYEVRSPPAWRHYVTTSLLAFASQRSFQQHWGEQPKITRPQVYRIVYELLPRKHWTPSKLLQWPADTQLRNARSRRSHARRGAKTVWAGGTVRLRALPRPSGGQGPSLIPSL